jgi:hypothetical protein
VVSGEVVSGEVVSGEVSGGVVSGEVSGGVVSGEVSGGVVSGEVSGGVVSGEVSGGVVSGEVSGGVVSGEVSGGVTCKDSLFVAKCSLRSRAGELPFHVSLTKLLEFSSTELLDLLSAKRGVNPGRQKHSVISLAPSATVSELAGHCSQEILPSVPLWVPTGHRTHVLDSFSSRFSLSSPLSKPLSLLGRQRQSRALLAFVYWCVLEPSGQAVQFRLSCDRKKPAGQPMHDRGV